MNPATHFLVGWVVANAPGLERRERAAVAIAGVVADVDGLGIVAELATRGSERPLLWWSNYHHVFGHNLAFALLCAAAAFAVAKRRGYTALMALLAFHLHLLGDVVGARGPDGDQWPVPYLYPFSDALNLTWSGQWALNAWPNFLITGVALILMFVLAWRRGFSPLEMVSLRADRAFVNTLHERADQWTGRWPDVGDKKTTD